MTVIDARAAFAERFLATYDDHFTSVVAQAYWDAYWPTLDHWKHAGTCSRTTAYNRARKAGEAAQDIAAADWHERHPQ